MEEILNTTSNDVELVFIPAPGVGHLISTVEIAKHLTNRDEHLSIIILIMKLPFESAVDTYVKSLAFSTIERICFIDLPRDNSNSPVTGSMNFFTLFVETQKPLVKDAVTQIIKGPSFSRLSGFVVDMMCSTMIDVANEFHVPTYLYFTSNASFLGLVFHLQRLHDDNKFDVIELKDSDTELPIPVFSKPVLVKVFPSMVFNKDGFSVLLGLARRYREIKGIMVNTFLELESHAIHSLSSLDTTIPPIYPVGPILELKKNDRIESDDIMAWLDKQPTSSVVFLCFGSMGSFNADQVKEIAHGLELSGYRFLWSLRRSPAMGKFEFPKDYEKPEEVLPEGFLKRTADFGKIIGWAPQTAVLAHPAVGGFVSHCGWNSTLESLWFGVPIATWPLYAEQQFNAFALVKELEAAVEIKIDYRRDPRYNLESEVIVSAQEIDSAIRCLMDEKSDVRKKVRELKEKSRLALQEGGSSHMCLGQFIEDVMHNTPGP